MVKAQQFPHTSRHIYWINSEWPLAWCRRPGVTSLHLLQRLLQTKNSTWSTDRRYPLLSEVRLGRRERAAAPSSLLSSWQMAWPQFTFLCTSMHLSSAIFPLLIHNSLLSLLNLFSLWLRWAISRTPSNKSQYRWQVLPNYEHFHREKEVAGIQNKEERLKKRP